MGVTTWLGRRAEECPHWRSLLGRRQQTAMSTRTPGWTLPEGWHPCAQWLAGSQARVQTRAACCPRRVAPGTGGSLPLPEKEVRRDSLVSKAMTFPAASQPGHSEPRSPRGSGGDTEAPLKEACPSVMPPRSRPARRPCSAAVSASQAACAQEEGRGVSAATTWLWRVARPDLRQSCDGGVRGRSAGTFWGHCSPGNKCPSVRWPVRSNVTWFLGTSQNRGLLALP